MKEGINNGGQEALGHGEVLPVVQPVTVEQTINEKTGAEEITLTIQTNQLGRYETALGPVTILGISSITDPRSRANLRLDLSSEDWLQKGPGTQARYRYKPRRIGLSDRGGMQQLAGSSQGHERWLNVQYLAKEYEYLEVKEAGYSKGLWHIPVNPESYHSVHRLAIREDCIMYGQGDDNRNREWMYHGMDEGMEIVAYQGRRSGSSWESEATLEQCVRLLECMAYTVQDQGWNNPHTLKGHYPNHHRVEVIRAAAIAECAIDYVERRLTSEPNVSEALTARWVRAQNAIRTPLGKEEWERRHQRGGWRPLWQE